MGQLAGQVTIVGEQEHTRGVAVQTTHGIDTLAAGILHEVHHRLAVLGVIAGGHIILGLVEEHIDLLLDGHELVVEHHGV